MRWYKTAVKQEDAAAQCNLGLMFVEGRGAAQDDVKAAMWFKKAAENGHACAQYYLGQLL